MPSVNVSILSAWGSGCRTCFSTALTAWENSSFGSLAQFLRIPKSFSPTFRILESSLLEVQLHTQSCSIAYWRQTASNQLLVMQKKNYETKTNERNETRKTERYRRQSSPLCAQPSPRSPRKLFLRRKCYCYQIRGTSRNTRPLSALTRC